MGRKEMLVMMYVKKFLTGFNEVIQIIRVKSGLRKQAPDFNRQ